MELELRGKVTAVQISLDMMRLDCTYFIHVLTYLVSIQLPTSVAYKEHVASVRRPLQA